MAGNPSITVCIACTHAGVPRDFKDKITKLREGLQNRGYEVWESVSLEGSIALDVYIGGSHEDECDLLVAVCNHESIELGILIGRRLEKEKPLLLAAFLATRTARLIVDAEHESSYVETTYVQSAGELVKSVVKHLNLLGFALPEVPESEPEGTHAAA